MLSKFIKLRNDCSLCSKLINNKVDPDYVFDGGHQFLVFKSPFADRWPGALMPIYRRHILEHKNLFGRNGNDTFQSLVSLERALFKVTGCNKINFVKFGNVADHLHWHIIPRYPHENYKEKNPWELSECTFAELYSEKGKFIFEKKQTIYSEIKKEYFFENNQRPCPYFGCALFLRPKDAEIREKALKWSIPDFIQKARAHPRDFECLLMKRNYFDFAWDFIGGNSDPNEFPETTMIREVKEEMGWTIKDSFEVCRQWRQSNIKGFVYLAIPTERNYMQDDPPRILCDEVQMVKYFGLLEIIQEDLFSDCVKSRIKAFIDDRRDFLSTD